MGKSLAVRAAESIHEQFIDHPVVLLNHVRSTCPGLCLRPGVRGQGSSVGEFQNLGRKPLACSEYFDPNEAVIVRPVKIDRGEVTQ